MRHLLALLGVAVVLAIAPARAEGPRIVATIPPLQSLAAMAAPDEAPTPVLLLPPGSSPHNYSLRPSDATALGRADLVAWVGPALESGLERALMQLGRGAEKLAMQEAPGMVTHPLRDAGVLEDDHGHGHGHEDGDIDPHLWLDPRNAVAYVKALGRFLERPVDEAVVRLEALDARLAERLAPVQGRPFLVLHDSLQYLEKRYDLRAVGSLSLGPDRQPGARRLAQLRAVARETGARCLVAEPGVPDSALRPLIEGLDMRIARIDPLGAEGEPGADLYPAMMADAVARLVDCLQGK